MGVQVKAWKGAWWIFRNHKGQRKAKRVGTGKEGRKAAMAAAEKIQARLVLGDLSLLEEAQPQEITLREYAEQWLATDVALRQQPGTVETYRGVLRNHWLPELGGLPLSAITRQRIKTILQCKLMAGMKANMARSMLGVLRTCLNAAVEEERIMGNPAARVGKFSGRSRTEVEIFTPEALARLLQTTAEEMPEANPLVLTLARTGLRIGEALTLHVRDIDRDLREVSLRRTWGSRKKALGERRINTPKSRQTCRVDLSKQLSDILGSYLVTRLSDSEWVFPGKDGWPVTPSAFRYSVWLPLQSGVRYRKPHTLRHTFASMPIQAGESLAYVKEPLGHHSIKITVDVYGHLIPGTNKAAVDRLDEATGRNPDATDLRSGLRLVQGGQG